MTSTTVIADDLAKEPLVTFARELSARTILDVAAALEDARDADAEQAVAAAFGFEAEGLLRTPFQRHAMILGYNSGVVGFERLERHVGAPAAGWRRFDTHDEEYVVARSALAAEGIGHGWAARSDGSMVSHTAAQDARWLSQGCVQALLGGVIWPALTDYELTHVARLGHAVSAWQMYWLAELGRETCARHAAFDGLSVIADCKECSQLESDAADAEVRRRRLREDHAAEVASSAVDTLRYEVHAYWHGLGLGRFIIPAVDSLDHGVACDYARLHRGRVTSAARRLWADHCAEVGRDYSDSLAAYASRAAEVVGHLMAPTALVPASVHAARRAVRTLQDVASRVAEFNESGGAIEPTAAGVVAELGQLIKRLRGDETVDVETSDAVVAEGLQRVATDVEGHRRVFALGYRPTHSPDIEPTASREARIAAYVSKVKTSGSPIAPFIDTVLSGILEIAVDGPRQAPLLTELVGAVRAATLLEKITVNQGLLAECFARYAEHWGPDSGLENPAKRWYDRLTPAVAPPRALWDRYRIRPNPNIGSLHSPFEPAWLQAALDGVAEEPNDPVVVDDASRNHVLLGPGRDGPILLPYTSPRAKLLTAIQYTPTLGQLLADGHGEETLRAAITDEVVIVLDDRAPVDLGRKSTVPRALLDMVSPGINDPGPWEDEVQARYYEALCQRSQHYDAVAKALVDRVRFPMDAQVADLGCGTGVVTRHILARLGEEGRVVGVDPAPRMVAAATRLVSDPRATFEQRNAHTLLDAMPLGPGFSAILCSSAFWLERNPEVALRRVRRCLRRRGRFGLSVPAEYLGDVEHMTLPGAVAVASAVARAREDLGLAAPEATGSVHALLATPDRLRRTMERLGFDDVELHRFERDWTAAEYLDWMGQPVIVSSMVPGAGDEQHAAFLAHVAERVEGATPLKARWTLVTARRK